MLPAFRPLTAGPMKSSTFFALTGMKIRIPAVLPYLILSLVMLLGLTACGTRQVQDSLVGATAQQLVSHGIDDLMRNLPAADFSSHTGKRIFIASHFLANTELRDYADERLRLELARRFALQAVDQAEEAELVLNVFYTALGTDQSSKGFHIPLGFMPGMHEGSRINLITLDQFHGVAEMYYFLGPTGSELRSEVLQGRTRTDAIGLPIITIPISNIDRRGEGSN